MVRFTELNPEAYKGAILIVDIDGTVTNDRNPEVEVSAKQQLREMAKHARVYLCSNSSSTARFFELARETGTTYIGTPMRKPDPRILQLIPERAGKRIIVIGDKQLTDGRFAQKIGAEFVQTHRIIDEADRVKVKAIYFADDTYAWVKGKSVWLQGVVRPMRPYLELARPAQWVKNLLVFAPMFFAGKVYDPAIFGASLVAYVVFSLAASAVYVLNDLADVSADRLHPIKKHRPIARGDVRETKAVLFVGIILSILIMALALVPAVVPIALLYIGLNALYSFKLKHVAVVDIMLVSLFYLLRVVAGGVATGLALSPWILLCVLFGSLFVIVGKRRSEAHHDKRRAVLDHYSNQALDALLIICAGLSIISYGLYSILGHHAPALVYSTIFVVFAFFRMLNDIYLFPHEAETPERLVFKDKWLFVSFVGWAAYVFWLFYLASAI